MSKFIFNPLHSDGLQLYPEADEFDSRYLLLDGSNALDTPADGEVLSYDSSSGKVEWVSQNASNLWTQSGSDIYYNSGNVGIGTTAPSQKLDVAGAVRLGAAGGAYDVLNTAGTGLGNDASGDLYWGNDPLLTSANLGDFGVSSVANSDGTLTISPTTGAVIASLNLANANTWTGAQTFSADTYFPGSGIWNTSGNVGIGTTAPGVKLSVMGNISVNNLITASSNGDSTANQTLVLNGSGGGGTDGIVLQTAGYNRLAIGGNSISNYGALITPNANDVGLIVRGDAGGATDIQQWQNSAGTTLSQINSAGYFGIGIAPTEMIHMKYDGAKQPAILFQNQNNYRYQFGISAGNAFGFTNINTGISPLTFYTTNSCFRSPGATNPTSVSLYSNPATYAFVIYQNKTNSGLFAIQGTNAKNILTLSEAGGGDPYANLGLYNDGTQTINFKGSGDSYFNAGNVGIGTTSPSTKLHIGAGAMTLEAMTAPSSPASDKAVLFLEATGTSPSRIVALKVKWENGTTSTLASVTV